MTARERVGSNGDPLVLLIDGGRSHDDPFVTALVSEGFRFALVRNGEEGLHELLDAPPDVVIVNATLPDMSGLSMLRRIRTSVHPPVIVLSDQGDETEAVLAFEMGAADYLYELDRTREAAARIRAARAHSGSSVPASSDEGSVVQDPRGVLQGGPVLVDLGRREVQVRGERKPIRPKEFDLLALLVSNAGYVVSTEHIFSDVWSKRVPRDSKTLQTHVRRLRLVVEKDPNHPRHILTIKGTGLRFEP